MSTEQPTPAPAVSPSSPSAPVANTPAPASPAPSPNTAGDPANPQTPAPVVEPSWREKWAGDNKDRAKVLGRYNSEKDYIDATFELRKTLDSGEYKKVAVLPENATPEQLTEYRKSVGVPESADKYQLNLPKGLVIGDTDKPIIDNFLAKAHKHNLPGDAANATIAAYYEMEAEMKAAEVQKDREFQSQSEEALRGDWGHEYLANKNMANDFAVNEFGKEVGEALMSAGPDVIKAVASIARRINPAMTLVPNSNDPLKSIDTELETLSKQVGTPEWMRDTAKQQRYIQLLEGKAQIKR